MSPVNKEAKDSSLFEDLLPLEVKGKVIAGPCSAESEQQVVETALALKEIGIQTYRAGLWKPRTKPGGFEGVGSLGIPWLLKVAQTTGMDVCTEVATREHVRECLEAGIKLFWIGARTTTNPFAIQEIADAISESGKDVTVLVKNPVNPDINLWIGGLERLYNAGVRRLGAIHRGFSAYGQDAYRNPPQWSLPSELRRRLPQLPVYCDPSHIGGKRALIAPLSQQALDLGFDGLFIESHIHPDEALSDSLQQVTPAELGCIIAGLSHRGEDCPKSDLMRLRAEMDSKDAELLRLLSERMAISREIGEMKKEEGIKVFQHARYKELISSRIREGEKLGMSPEFIRRIYSLIHEESVRQQLEV